MAFTVDKYFLTDVENAVSKGSDSIRKICKALGIPYSTFNDNYYGKSAKSVNEKILIDEAIARGRSKLRGEFLRAAENSLVKLVNGYESVEVTQEEWTDANGIMTKTHMTTKTKQIAPNTTLVIFTLVNNSEHWKSINNANIINVNEMDEDVKNAIKLLGTSHKT